MSNKGKVNIWKAFKLTVLKYLLTAEMRYHAHYKRAMTLIYYIAQWNQAIPWDRLPPTYMIKSESWFNSYTTGNFHTSLGQNPCIYACSRCSWHGCIGIHNHVCTHVVMMMFILLTGFQVIVALQWGGRWRPSFAFQECVSLSFASQEYVSFGTLWTAMHHVHCFPVVPRMITSLW